MEINKRVDLDLTTIDGNAFMLMGAFQNAARRADWSAEEIEFVLKEARSGEYDHLVATLAEYCA